ncbi:MAG: phospholipase D-like domain-containing protein, partial [Dehalococcoidia bacterium]
MTPELDRTENNQVAGGYGIPIIHCSEREFFDAFRADLAGSTEHVTILSPFLSQNRAIRYYPVLRSLMVRQVKVEVYARPRHEQPETLRALCGEVERGLKRAGVRFHVRPGMHEKVGMIDGRILWHGSLNIFSHNDTRESMLRFESPELVQEVWADLGLGPFSYPSDRGEPTYSIEVEKAPSCPKCGRGGCLMMSKKG